MALRDVAERASEYWRSVITTPTLPAEARDSTSADEPAEASPAGPDGLAPLTRRLPLIVFALTLALVCLGVLAVFFQRAWTSDDVSVQNMVANWQPGGAHTIWITPDTWLLKAPFYLLLGLLLPNSPLSLLISALVFNLVAFGLFFAAYLRFVGRRPRLDEYLPLVWLVTLGLNVYSILFVPNVRNAELGLGFLLIMLVVRFVGNQGAPPITEEWTASRIARVLAVALAVAVVVGFLVFNDPLFLYLFVAPLCLALVIRLLWGGGSRDLAALVTLGLTVPVASLWTALFERLHFAYVPFHPAFVTLDQLGVHVNLGFQGLLTLFNAGFFGSPPFGKHGIGSLINFGVLTLVLAAPLILRATRRQMSWGQWFIVLQPHFVVLVFLVSNQVNGAVSARYLILAPFYGAISLALLFRSVPNARVQLLFIAVLLASMAFNALPEAKSLAHGYQDPNARNYAVIRVAEQHGLTKGFGDYWDGPINTYLSGNQVQFIQTKCIADGVHFFAWLVDDALLQLPAAQTFYVYDSLTVNYPACAPPALAQQFGSPTDVIPIDSHTTIYIYDYDITASLRGLNP